MKTIRNKVMKNKYYHLFVPFFFILAYVLRVLFFDTNVLPMFISMVFVILCLIIGLLIKQLFKD